MVFSLCYIEIRTALFFFYFKFVVLSPSLYRFINTAALSFGQTSRETSSSTE